MAGLRGLLKKDENHDEKAYKAAEVLRAKWPVIAEILGGTPAAGKEAAISPGTITLFVGDGQFRFSANVKSEKRTLIGDIADATSPFDSIEYALSEGLCRQKEYTERVNGSATKPGDVPVY